MIHILFKDHAGSGVVRPAGMTAKPAGRRKLQPGQTGLFLSTLTPEPSMPVKNEKSLIASSSQTVFSDLTGHSDGLVGMYFAVPFRDVQLAQRKGPVA
jgi:hypothetical protein